MDFKNEYVGQIITILKNEQKPVNPSVITQKLGWNKDKIDEVCNLFSVKSFVEILRKIDGIKVEKDKHGTAYVTLGGKTNDSFSSKQVTNNEKSTQNLRKRIEHLLNLLNSGLYEKEEAIRLALLSAAAGESIFFLGPPGTAKSMISSRIHHAFKEGTKYFEYLMNEFSTPDEIFGSVKLKGLDEGIYEKNTNGYLPEANVAFLDEIWKSGPAILNTLLTIINEKKFRNGDKVEKVPLQVLLAASNELPKEKAGLEALYDRFIIRTMVNPVSMDNEESFFALCEKSGKELVVPENMKSNLLTIEEVQNWSEKINEAALTDNIKEVIMEIRRELEVKNQEKNREEKEKYYVSDRRWKKIIHLLKTSAFLCDREEVDLMDLQLITYCIWNTPKQREEVKSIVKEIVQEHGLECTTAIDDIEQQIKVFEKYISEHLYEKKPSSLEPVTYKMNDGHEAYKLNKPFSFDSYNTIEPYYITIEDVWRRNDRIGAYYDEEKGLINDYDNSIKLNSFNIKGNIFTWINKYTEKKFSAEIETKTIKFELKKKEAIFMDNSLLALIIIDINKKYYSPIETSIEQELQKLLVFRSKIETPYDENLFADKSFKEVITSKIEEEKQKLEDAKLELDKQKNRYEK